MVGASACDGSGDGGPAHPELHFERFDVQIGVREIEANSKLINGADVLMRRRKFTPVAIQFHKIVKE